MSVLARYGHGPCLAYSSDLNVTQRNTKATASMATWPTKNGHLANIRASDCLLYSFNIKIGAAKVVSCRPEEDQIDDYDD